MNTLANTLLQSLILKRNQLADKLQLLDEVIAEAKNQEVTEQVYEQGDESPERKVKIMGLQKAIVAILNENTELTQGKIIKILTAQETPFRKQSIGPALSCLVKHDKITRFFNIKIQDYVYSSTTFQLTED